MVTNKIDSSEIVFLDNKIDSSEIVFFESLDNETKKIISANQKMKVFKDCSVSMHIIHNVIQSLSFCACDGCCYFFDNPCFEHSFMFCSFSNNILLFIKLLTVETHESWIAKGSSTNV